MELAFRWLTRIALGLAALLLAGLALVAYLVGGSLPEYDADHVVPSLQRPMEIVRDRHAVPHIFAQTELDSFFGLGFVHAQDRLWQMEIARRTAQGRLSLFFGADTVNVDHLMRALDLYRLSAAAVAQQTPEVRAALEAYAAGVNAWLSIVARDALGRGAPEFYLFSDRIAPWTPTDSIAITKLMAFQLTGQAAEESRTELLRRALQTTPERLRDILPEQPGPAVIALPEFAQRPLDPNRIPRPIARRQNAAVPPAAPPAAPPVAPPVAPLGTTPAATPPFLPRPGFGGASNAFAADTSRTATGIPVMATDPHLGLTAPSIWFLARMGFPEGDVIGGTIPGIPSIVIGRNADFGWGLTTAYVDDQDLYLERLDPEDPDRYLTASGYVAFRSREVIIEVAGEAARKVRLRWTQSGRPVLPDWYLDAGILAGKGHVISLAWTALTAEDRSIESLLRVMRSRSVAEAIPILALTTAPAQNVIMADRTSIAMQVAGVAPLRQIAHATRGRLPAQGWLAANAWLGRVPFDAMPRVVAPEGGLVVNTNNRTTDAAFPQHLSYYWGDSQRIRRARRLLEARAFHSRDSFIEIQTDIVSEAARTLLPLMMRDIYWTDQPLADDEAARFRQRALTRLADWNGEMDALAPEPLIYAAWARALQRRLAIDELGASFARVSRVEPVFLERVLRDIDGAGIWCDITKTAAIEACADIARLALDDALSELSEAQGSTLDSWRWGDAHIAKQTHQVLGQVFPLSLFTNIELPTPGGDHTLQRGQMRGTGDHPYANIHASGFRAVYDFSDPNGSVFIIATGQSGHPFSRHYDDLAALWQRGEYIRMTLAPEAARAGAIGTTRLVPNE
ncbi:MAG: penicillin acylase family protein [Pseudomonadota bacterium]